MYCKYMYMICIYLELWTTIFEWMFGENNNFDVMIHQQPKSKNFIIINNQKPELPTNS